MGMNGKVVDAVRANGGADAIPKSYWLRCFRRVDWGGAFTIIPVGFNEYGKPQPHAKLSREVVYSNWLDYQYSRWLEKYRPFDGYLFAIGTAPLIVLDVDEREGRSSRLDVVRRLWELVGDGDFESLPYVDTFRGGRHYYFRVPGSIWLSIIGHPDSSKRIDLVKESILGFGDTSLLDGVEVFVSKPIFGMGSIRAGKVYRPRCFENIRSVLDIPEIPSWLLHILSGGRWGSLDASVLDRLREIDDSYLSAHLAKLDGSVETRVVPSRISSGSVSDSSDDRDALDAKLVAAGILKNPDVSLWEAYLDWVTGLAYPARLRSSRIKVLPTAAGCRRTWQIACPFHDDQEPSATLSVNGKMLVRCHACSSKDSSWSAQTRIYYSHVGLLYVYMYLTGRLKQSLFVQMMYDLDSRARQSLRYSGRDVLGWRQSSLVWDNEDVARALAVYVSSPFGRRIYEFVPPQYGRLLDMPKIYETPANRHLPSVDRAKVGDVRASSSWSQDFVTVKQADISSGRGGGSAGSRTKIKLSSSPKEVYKRYQKRYNDRGLHVIGELVKLGDHVCIAGRPGSYKSTLLRAIAYSVASGGSLFGRPCPVRNVLYVNFDDSSRKLSYSLSRLEDMLPSGTCGRLELLDFRDKEIVDVVMNEYGGDYVAAIADTAELCGADVVILDGLNHLLMAWASTFFPNRRSDAVLNDYALTTEALADIHKRLIGSSRVLFSTIHTPKGLPPIRESADVLVDMGHSPMGSTGIHGGVDVVWLVDVVDAGERVQLVKQTKNREAGAVSYYLKYDDRMLRIVREEMKFDYAKRLLGSKIVDDDAGGQVSDGSVEDVSVSVSVESSVDSLSSAHHPQTASHLPLGSDISASSLGSIGGSRDSDPEFFKPHLICRLDKILPTRKYRLDVDSSMGDDSVIVFDPSACSDPNASYYMSVRPYRKGESYDNGLDSSFSFYGYALLHVLSGVRAFEGKTPKDVRQLIFDIEVSNINPKNGKVLAIGYKFTDGDLVVSDVLIGEESDILRRFFEIVEDYNPDWLVGYNIFDFDIPYLLARAEHYGLEFSWLSRNWYNRFTSFRAGTQQHDVDIYYPRAAYGFESRAVIDLYLLAHRYLMGLESYSLVSVYSHITGESVDALGDKSVMVDWDPELVRRQVLRDVEMTYRVLHELIVIPFALVDYVPALFSDILYQGNGSLWSKILTMDYIRRGLPILVGEPREIKGYEGAISVCRRTGIFGKTAKFDVVSLYPNIIVQHNIHSDRDYACLMPIWVKRLLEERVRLKKLAKETGDPMLDARQNALKVIINSAYGFLGTNGLYWSYEPAAAEVTRYGREVLRQLEDLIAVHHLPIELDTDGVLFAVSDSGVPPSELISELESRIGYKLDLEEYDACISVAAKNYALLAGDKIIIKGASLKNRGQSKYIMQVMRRVIERLLHDSKAGKLDLVEIMRLIEMEASAIMDPDRVPDELLIEKVVASRRTADRNDVEWDLNDGDVVLAGKQYYIYYAKGRRKRVISVGMPSERGLVLDRMKYVRKFYDSLTRLLKIESFAAAFNDYFGGVRSFLARFGEGQVVMEI